MSTPTLEVLPATEFEHDIFTTEEAAKILRVGRTTMYNLIRARQIQHIKCCLLYKSDAADDNVRV